MLPAAALEVFEAVPILGVHRNDGQLRESGSVCTTDKSTKPMTLTSTSPVEEPSWITLRRGSMRWLVNSNGQTSGPMDESMVVTLVKAGQIAPDAFLREESQSAWIPIAETPFAQLVAPQPPPRAVPPPQNVTRIQTLVVVCAALFAIYFYVTCGESHKSASAADVPPLPPAAAAAATPPAPAATARDDSTMAWVMAQEFVKKHLKAPGSADFGHVLDGTFQRPEDCCSAVGDGSWKCKGWVDAQNEFGAKLRADFAITLKRDGDSWTALSGPTLNER